MATFLKPFGGNDLAGHAALFVIAGQVRKKREGPFPSGTLVDPVGICVISACRMMFWEASVTADRTSDDRHYPGGGQLLGGEGGRARIARVVFHNQLDLLAVDAARLVHFRNERL